MDRKKLCIPYPIIVEGKYDKARICAVCEADVYTTDGFGIFKKKEKLSLFSELSKKTEIIVLTDSDDAGRLIRSHISSAIPQDRIIQLHIPRIKGVEKRKREPSAQGFLGVEGMDTDLIYGLLLPFENREKVRLRSQNPLCKTDLYIDGLTGGDNSATARDRLCERIGLPRGMSAPALLAALRILMTYDEYIDLVGRNNA